MGLTQMMNSNDRLKNVSWGVFPVHKIFIVDYGTKLDLGKMTHDNPTISFVSRSSINNGVSDHVDEIQGVIPYKSGSITLALGGSLGACFVQNSDFYTSQNVAVITTKEQLSLETKLFITRMMTFECQTKYQAFGRELNSHLKTDLTVSLPISEDGNPNWKFMHDYISSLKNNVKKQCKEIISIANNDTSLVRKMSNRVDIVKFKKWSNLSEKKPLTLNKKNWKPFSIGELFTTYTGGDLIIGNVDKGDIPVISHSAVNNSVQTYSSIINGRKLFDHNKTLSLADRGTFFSTIQPRDFYIGTRVKALEAKYDDISLYSLLFISVVINKEKFRFNYGRNCTDSLDELRIYLPAKEDKLCLFSDSGYLPDWSLMDNFIKSLPYSDRI